MCIVWAHHHLRILKIRCPDICQAHPKGYRVMYFVKFISRLIRRTPFVPSPVQISNNNEGGGWRSKTHRFQIVVLAELVTALTGLKSRHRVICRLSLLWLVLIPASKFVSLDLRFSSLPDVKQHFP